MASAFSGNLSSVHKGCKQGFFSVEEAVKYPMHEGDVAILRAIHNSNLRDIIDGIVVHVGNKLEFSDFRIVFLEKYPNLTSARQREIQLKKWSRGKKEFLIDKYRQGFETKL